MPRIRRSVRPGALVHIIVRFVNHEFLLDTAEERAEYLRRARIAFLRTDWVALSFALMSSHTHFAAIAGACPFADWSRPLHAGFVGWLNNTRGRLGAGIANRPSTHEVPLEACARLLAYHHNNPVRAGLAASARESDWTSHNAYRLGRSPDWLRVDLGLELAGFDVSEDGRAEFDAFVNASIEDQWSLTDADLLGLRREARRQFGSAIEIGQPVVADPVEVPIYSPSAASIRPTWGGSIDRIAKATCQTYGIDHSTLVNTQRGRHIVAARRAFLLVVVAAGRALTEAAAYLGISIQAASKGIQKADAVVRGRADSIAKFLGIIGDLG